MKIYIHTYGRAKEQFTWKNLPRALHSQTSLVVQHRERDLYPGYPTIVLPPEITTLSPTRQWIIEYHHREHEAADPKLCLLDDDITAFDKRRTDNIMLCVRCTEQEISEIFNLLDKALDKYAHAGILTREGNKNAERAAAPYLEAFRMMRILAYDSRVLHRLGVRFDRIPCKQDFDMTLQLLRAGYPNYVITKFVQGQGNSQSSGGCSSYRTQQMLTETCHQLAALHPGFVRVVQKTTESAWGATKEKPVTRDEVSIQWKKAYRSSGADLLDDEDILS